MGARQEAISATRSVTPPLSAPHLSPALLQPQVAVVAIVGELLATLPRRAEMMLLPVSPLRLYSELEKFTRELRSTLYSIDDTWWRRNVTTDEDDPPTSLSQALATYKSAPRNTENPVAMAASEWQSMAIHLEVSWESLARRATWLRNTCREVVTEAANMVPTATTWARELQHKAACDGTAQENVVELGQALGREEGAEVVAGFEAPVRRDARVAVSWAARASMVRQRVEVTLGLLERLAAACDAATAFPRELQRLLEGIRAALEGTNEASPDIPEDLVAKVAMAKRMWEANARLVKDHLVGTVPDTIKFLFNGDPASLSACEVAERCQRATEDIPRLLQPLESPQSIPKVSPVIMELQELSPALLQPQVTVVAILGELLATLPSRAEMMLLSAVNLYRDLVKFTRDLRTTLYSIDDTWWHYIVTSDDDDPPTSLSQALATYKSTPGTTQKHVTMAASHWEQPVSVLENGWARLASAATELHNACREVVNEAAAEAATATARARELQDKAARYGTAQENMVEWGLALRGEEGAEVLARYEAQVRRDARVAVSEATRATMERQWVEVALGLLERLVATCAEATAFPRELQRLRKDIEAALKGTNEASPNIPEDLLAKVALAEQLLETNARLATRHLVGTLPNTIKFYFDGDPASPSGCEVAEWCQRAIEDIVRLCRSAEHPQGVPKVSPVSMELQELSPVLLQPQVTVVAILGELLATLPSRAEMKLMSPRCLYWDLVAFTEDLRATLYRIDDTWWHRNVTSDDDDPPPSLSQALATCESTSWTTQKRVTMAARKWQGLVSVLVDRWARLARMASNLHYTCRKVVTEAADMVVNATTQARELQDMAAHDGTAQENMVELGQALDGEEGAEVVAGHEAQVRRDASMAASEETRVTKVRQWLEVALGLLERLVVACEDATALPRELQWRLRDTQAALKGTNEASPNVPEDLVAKVVEAERLWEANARLVKDHLVGTLPDNIKFYIDGGTASPSACEVVERCQRAIEDIASLVRSLHCPQSVPKVSPGSMDLQELSPALLQSQDTVVAILGELLATMPRRDKMNLVSAVRLYWDLVDFTQNLWVTLYCTDDTWWHRKVTSNDDDPLSSLSQGLATYKSTPCTTWDHGTMEAIMWQGSLAVLVGSWAELARKATKLHNTCREVVNEAATKAANTIFWAGAKQNMAAHDGTAQENTVELGPDLGREEEEGDEVVARHEAQLRRDAREAASEATRATMVRQWAEAALGLLERLVAACDEAATFPQELQRLLRDTKAVVKGTNEAFHSVPEDLVAKVAVAKRLWEANARLTKDRLLGAVPDTIKFLFTGAPDSPSGVAERCQRAIEDIPRLLQPLEHPQGVPKVSPESMEPQELSPVLLQPQINVVAILGELLATVPTLDEEMVLMPPRCLYRGLEDFTTELWDAMMYTESIWRRHKISLHHDDPLTSLSWALAAYKSTPWTTWDHVTMAVSKWHRLVAKLVDSWAKRARMATKLRNTWREVASEVANMVTTFTILARELQDKAACHGTAQEKMVKPGLGLGKGDGAKVVAGHEARVRRDACVAASQATRATWRRQHVEAALGLLERGGWRGRWGWQEGRGSSQGNRREWKEGGRGHGGEGK
ncbi:uncharacterized protein LOC120505111 [Passer montanus]|uniref:uncharacterized protein LOC120505111 n=1 Tax=Passer montanus TaxID=9160 RepID=UPI0019600259|nr:uncharacterized protein LOC120505111 [Passer montanus]